MNISEVSSISENSASLSLLTCSCVPLLSSGGPHTTRSMTEQTVETIKYKMCLPCRSDSIQL